MLSDIRLRHYRSYNDATFEFEPGVNIIVGPNASGKTNILEAVLILCRGSSHRAKDQQLINHGKNWATISGHIDGHERIFKLSETEEGTKKEFQIDSQKFSRLALGRRSSCRHV